MADDYYNIFIYLYTSTRPRTTKNCPSRSPAFISILTSNLFFFNPLWFQPQQNNPSALNPIRSVKHIYTQQRAAASTHARPCSTALRSWSVESQESTRQPSDYSPGPILYSPGPDCTQSKCSKNHVAGVTYYTVVSWLTNKARWKQIWCRLSLTSAAQTYDNKENKLSTKKKKRKRKKRNGVWVSTPLNRCGFKQPAKRETQSVLWAHNSVIEA